MTQPTIAILGAGPAGLGAAQRLGDRARVKVFERASRVGGNAGSFDFAGQRVDFGSHRLHPACEPAILRDIQGLLGDQLLTRPRHGRIHLRGRWIHFPLKPVDLLLRVDRRFALGVGRDMFSSLLPTRDRLEETFRDVLANRLGPTICRDFYFPYARKIWGVEPQSLDAVQARRRVSAGSFGKLLRKVLGAVPGVKPIGFSYFYYPKNGFGQISQAYAEAARKRGAEILLEQTVVGLELGESDSGAPIWTVRTAGAGGERSFSADHVWSTLPVTLLARLVRPEAPSAVQVAADSMRFRAMLIAYLKLPVAQFSEFDAHYFPGEKVLLTRLSEPKNYTGTDSPQGSTVLCAEIPCDVGDDVWSMDDALVAEKVSDDLARVGLPLPAAVEEIRVQRLPQAYPIYDTGYAEHLDRLEAWIDGLPNLLSYGRQGLFAHDNTHHALAMAYAAVDCLRPEGFDRECWNRYREIFETHVVED